MPYAIGLQAAAAAFLSAGFGTQFTIAVVVFLLITFISSSLKEDEPNTPVYIPGNSLRAIIPFFRRRHEFLNWGFQATGHNIYQFQLLKNKVIVVSGESARVAFFTARHLDLTEGFKILSGAIPMVRGVTSDLQMQRVSLIHKRLGHLQRNGPLSELIPLILEDSRKIMESWGTVGQFDPFDKVYELIFQTTIRSLTCAEIADNPKLVARLKVLYDRLDSGTTPATVLVPWLPTPAMIRKLMATKEIYDIVIETINNRKSSGKWKNDALQMLLDSGDETLVVVGFIMGLLIAGARATGTTASWMITYLSSHPEWQAKGLEEVERLIATYNISSAESSSQSLTSQLAAIPLEAWESEAPVLDSIIRETTRVAQPHAAMRRNLGPEIYIDGKIIPTGAYVIYPFSDVHLDPDIYPDPMTFNPGRPDVSDASFKYVGWGGGKTTCLGTRLAKVELRLVAAMFMLAFRPSIVDSSGDTPSSMPTPNWNDIFLCRPPINSFYLKYEKKSVLL